jgi:hypothetical protein
MVDFLKPITWLHLGHLETYEVEGGYSNCIHGRPSKTIDAMVVGSMCPLNGLVWDLALACDGGCR